jgi:hypothetical protein
VSGDVQTLNGQPCALIKYRPVTVGIVNATRRSAVDAVGVSVAFQGVENSSAAGFNSPLEEVLRTRWPGCRVDWQGQAPPSID